MDSICRLCAGIKTIESFVNSRNINAKLEKCCQIAIYENDGLPQNVCDDCFQSLEDTWKFVTKVHQAQESLQRIFLSTCKTKLSEKRTKILRKISKPIYHAIKRQRVAEMSSEVTGTDDNNILGSSSASNNYIKIEEYQITEGYEVMNDLLDECGDYDSEEDHQTIDCEKNFRNITKTPEFVNSTPNTEMPETQHRVPEVNSHNFENLVLAKIEEITIKQDAVLEKFEAFEAEYNSKQIADNKITSNCLVLLKRVAKSVVNLSGEAKDDVEEELIETFPIKTLTDLTAFDIRLQDPSFAKATIAFLKKRLESQGLFQVFRSTAYDDIMFEFNLDGRCGKRKLMALELYNTVLYKSCADDFSRKTYESELRSYIHRAHNRYNKAKWSKNTKHLKNTNNVTT